MSVALRRLAEVNPPVPEFDEAPSHASITFMPLEACWADGRADLSRRATKSTVASGYTRFRSGDVLLPKITPTFEAGRVFPANIQTGFGAATTEVHVLRAKSHSDPRFLAYIARSLPFLQLGAASLQGVGNLRRVTTNFVQSFPVTAFERRQQTAIADYLDRETAQIDTLIAKQEQLIAGLRERRAARILEAVTQGVESGVVLTESSLDWARRTPSHWTELNIRRVADMRTGHTPSKSNPEFWENTTIPWFTLADVWQLRDARRTFLGETASNISELGLANSAADLLPAGTVILSRTASVGFSGIMPVPMATSQDFWNWVCGPRIIPEYLMYTFRAMRDHLLSLMIGSTHKTIYQPIAAALRIPLPPIDEQHTIVAALRSELDQIDTLIAKAERFIELSKERRAALITAAVTGQIEVPAG